MAHALTTKDRVPQIPTAALVASAVRLSDRKAKDIYVPAQSWQIEAYRQYSICGEARFAATFLGHALSRCSLMVSLRDEKGVRRSNNEAANAALKRLFAGAHGQSQMLEAAGIHLTIGGEFYMVGRTIDGQDVWELVSPLEISKTGAGENEKWFVEYEKGVKQELHADDLVIRVWRPDPSRRMLPDSPFKSLLPTLTEIEWLTRHIFTQAQSRLTGAGLLLLPQSITFPRPPNLSEEQARLSDIELLMISLAEAMMTPISDPSNPAAFVPYMMQVPEDAVDKVRLIHFWSELDSHALELRADAIKRFALGMDMPPERVLGMSSNGGTGGGNSNGVSHWGAWQIEEDTVKMHIEPMLELVCNALTVGYLRVAVNEEIDEIIYYDTSNLRLRPDRSKEAFQLYDRGLLSIRRLLEENGFDPQDLPEAEELKEFFLRKVATGSATPDQVAAALTELGVPLNIPALPASEAPVAQEVRETPPPPSIAEHPTRPRTPEESSVSPALLAACDSIVFRALERAGNRLRQRGGRPPGVYAHEVHTAIKAEGLEKEVLQDAFSHVDRLVGWIADPAVITPLLEGYCTTLFLEQSPHERERLEKWLEKGLAHA